MTFKSTIVACFNVERPTSNVEFEHAFLGFFATLCFCACLPVGRVNTPPPHPTPLQAMPFYISMACLDNHHSTITVTRRNVAGVTVLINNSVGVLAKFSRLHLSHNFIFMI